MTKKSILKNIALILLPVALAISVALFMHARLGNNIADPDGFYHIRHSWIYKTEGLFNSAFPWAQYSVINKISADIWYGFHLLIIPFTYFQNLISGIKVGAIFVTIAALLLVYWSLKNLKVKWPIFWWLVFAFASPDLLFRFTMLRPHPLSLGLSLLLFSFLVSAKKDSWWPLVPIFFTSAVFSWIHISVSWIPILIAIVVLLLEILQKQGLNWQKIAAVGSGLFLGLILRPNPLGAAKLAYIQVVKLLLEKQGEIPLRFGRELTPFTLENFVDQLIPIAILLTLAIIFFGWLLRQKNQWQSLPETTKTSIMSSLILWVVFFVLAFAVARRSNEIFIGFGVIFTALLFSAYYPLPKKSSWSNIAIIAAIVALIYMPFKTIYRFDTFAANAFDPSRFKDLSEWLVQNAKPKEIVFNIHWDRFAQLFFWNHNNYYINGMDPIFEYALDPSFYWKTHFYSIDAATAFTCGQIRCTKEEAEDTYKVLKKDFRTSFLVIEKRRSPKFYKYAESAKNFQKVFENENEALFKIL